MPDRYHGRGMNTGDLAVSAVSANRLAAGSGDVTATSQRHSRRAMLHAARG